VRQRRHMHLAPSLSSMFDELCNAIGFVRGTVSMEICSDC
jgi:hypothetical protein